LKKKRAGKKVINRPPDLQNPFKPKRGWKGRKNEVFLGGGGKNQTRKRQNQRTYESPEGPDKSNKIVVIFKTEEKR